MKSKNILLTMALSMCSYSAFFGQANSVTVQAESGTLGSDFKILDTVSVTCVTIKTNFTAYPGHNRVNTYEVTFPGAGTYDLYARVMVGKNTYNDDSYYLPVGFGIKNDTLIGDWMLVNGLASGGYTVSTAVVDGAGSAQNLVWKWLNISKFVGSALPDTFVVPDTALTQTFQIGAREDGLYIDKFVFGKTGLYYTVADLNNGFPGSSTPPSQGPIGIPLAQGKSKFLGSELDNSQKPQFQGYWNQVTPGNAGKWGSVEGTRGSFVWTDLDTAYNFAKRNHFIFKEHNLIWGQQQPSWISALDSATQRTEIENWFSALAARYDSIDQIDVVNEPIHTPPSGGANANYIKALGGTGATGWDWIINAFKLARKHFPKSKLILNEYSVINSSTTTATYLNIINLLKADTLIDGIGEQAHAFTTFNTAGTTLKSNLDALAATGLPLYITELDIDGQTDLVQLHEYQRVFPIFWADTAVKGITLWGYRFGVWRNAQGAFIIDEAGVERPALTWLKAYVNDTLNYTQSITVTDSTGTASISKAGDSTRMIATILPVNTTIPRVSWSLSPAGLAKISAGGMLTAIANGVVTVTATAYDGSNVKGTKAITITNNLTGIANTSFAENISIYPNPSENGNITIQGIEKIKNIEVLDLTGRKVIEYNDLKQASLNIHLNTKGAYIVRFFDGEDYGFKKIIVK